MRPKWPENDSRMCKAGSVGNNALRAMFPLAAPRCLYAGDARIAE